MIYFRETPIVCSALSHVNVQLKLLWNHLSLTALFTKRPTEPFPSLTGTKPVEQHEQGPKTPRPITGNLYGVGTELWGEAINIALNRCKIHMSHFAYACKMQCPLNLVLENSEYLWFYWTFCIVILDYGLKLHKLSNHTLVILQKWLEIH